jgi:rhodanese-related sulfurtransferase
MTSVKQLLDSANAVVPRITPAQAREMMASDNVLIVDVRDAPEVEKSGKIARAVHVSRGMLEFRADPELSRHSPRTEPRSSIVPRVDVRRLAARCSRIWATRRSTTWVPSRIGWKAAAWLRRSDEVVPKPLFKVRSYRQWPARQAPIASGVGLQLVDPYTTRWVGRGGWRLRHDDLAGPAPVSARRK